MNTCTKCGSALSPDAKFCAVCGQVQGAAPEQQSYPPQQQAPPPAAEPPQTQYQAPQAPPSAVDPLQSQYLPQNQYPPQQYAPPPADPGFQQGQYPPPQAPPPGAYVQQNQYPPQQYAPPQGAYMQQNQFPPPAQPAVPAIMSISEVYRRVLSILVKKPLQLWGISLMFTLLSALAVVYSILPIIFIPITVVLNVGMISIFLAGYRGQHFEVAMLFKGFDDFKRIAGGMLWMSLWVLIWFLIPIAGPFIAIVKVYTYRFVPYILLTQPEVKATDAIKLSKEMTEGYKVKMFLADFLIGVAIFIVMVIFALLTRIPIAGLIFMFIGALVYIVVVAVLPLVMGLISAAFYDEIERVKK